MSLFAVSENTAVYWGVSLLVKSSEESQRNAVQCVILWTLSVCMLTLLCFSRSKRAVSVGHKSCSKKAHKSPPEVFSLPWIGNPGLLNSLPHLAVTKMIQTYGKIFNLNAGGDRTFTVVNDIDDIRTAMQKFPTALAGKPQSTTTQMTNVGAQRDMGKRWSKRRQLTMSAFKSLFRDYPGQVHKVCYDELERMVYSLKSAPQQGHEPTQDITLFVARTMWRLIYGRGQHPDQKMVQQLKTLATKIDEYTQNSGPFCILDRFSFLQNLVKASMKKYQSAVKFMNEFCNECEETRRFHGTDNTGPDLMTFMMRGAESLTPEDEKHLGLSKELLFKGVADLIRAGTESPSLLIIWVCLVLAKYQNVQDKVNEELQYYRTYGVSIVCEASAERLPYTHAVVYETIRFCSIVPFFKRRCLSDVTIGNHNLPSGSNIIINNHAISHDITRWGDPGNFRPERFINQDGTFDSTKLEVFLPFGIGKRRCMGEEIGKLLPFAAIATLVLNFNISSCQLVNLTPLFGITLTPQKQLFRFISR